MARARVNRRWVHAALIREGIPVSEQADDAEFLRRVTIDIIGRIPASHEAAALFRPPTQPGHRQDRCHCATFLLSHLVGIDHTREIDTPSGRRIWIVEAGEKLISELIS